MYMFYASMYLCFTSMNTCLQLIEIMFKITLQHQTEFMPDYVLMMKKLLLMYLTSRKKVSAPTSSSLHPDHLPVTPVWFINVVLKQMLSVNIIQAVDTTT